MNALATLMLLGWLPAMLVLAALVPVRVALLVCGIGGWLLLPQVSFMLPGLPNYEKSTAIGLGLLLAGLCFDPGPLLRVRWGWRDLPMAVWLVSAFASAIANGTGTYDATATFTYRLIDWGLPYCIGRAYFTSPEHVRMLLWGIFLGGVAYVAPALWEIRMSPQLHHIVYGAHQHSWEQVMRFGGYRPLVFTPHGLALSLWMAVATMAGVSLWRQRATPPLGVPLALLVLAVGGTMVLCKSLGALILLLVGVTILLAPYGRWLHAAILVAIPTYLFMRLTHVGGVDELLSSWAATLPPDRAASLQFRLDNEAVLIERGWQKPMFGWTPWSFLDPVVDEWGETRLIVCDSMWIINFVCNGLFGLGGVLLVLLLPAARAVLARRRDAAVVDARDHTTLGVIVTMFHVDCLVNSFLAPAYAMVVGSLLGATLGARAAAPAPAVAAPATGVARVLGRPRPRMPLLQPRPPAPGTR